MLSNSVCTYNVAQLSEKNSQRITQYILCREINSKRLYRLDYEKGSNGANDDKKKMFVYAVDGAKLGKKELPDNLQLKYITTLCNVQPKSNMIRNISAVVVVVFILSLSLVYIKYRIRINVSSFKTCDCLNYCIKH